MRDPGFSPILRSTKDRLHPHYHRGNRASSNKAHSILRYLPDNQTIETPLTQFPRGKGSTRHPAVSDMVDLPPTPVFRRDSKAGEPIRQPIPGYCHQRCRAYRMRPPQKPRCCATRCLSNVIGFTFDKANTINLDQNQKSDVD